MTRGLALLPLALGLLWPSLALAQALGFAAQGDKPILVEADDGIEWNQKEEKYVARGHASAKQGEIEVTADLLTAYYEASGPGKNQIHRIDAEGHVRIASPRETATGDRAVYNVKTGILLLTGREVVLVTPQDRIVAKDSLEYHSLKQLAVARGDARATRGEQHLSADTLMAHYKEKDTAGKKTSDLDHVEAIGNVLIVTPENTVRSERGDYDPATGLARLSGTVKMTHGQTQLNGQQAEVNMNSGVARMTAGGGGRVQALLEPGALPGQDTAKPGAAKPDTAKPDAAKGEAAAARLPRAKPPAPAPVPARDG